MSAKSNENQQKAKKLASRYFSAKIAAADKYQAIDFKPPASVAAQAKKGLDYRQKASPSNKGGLTTSEAAKEGIGSGVQRAVNLKNRDTLSPKVVKQMRAFFSRHEKNKNLAPEHKGTPWNDKGYVAWLLWGGDAGKTWAEKVVRQMETADKKKEASSYSIRAGEDGNYMTVQHLQALKDHATKLLEFVDESTPLPDWLIAKVNKANTHLLEATEYLMHGHGQHHPAPKENALEANWGKTIRPSPQN